MLKMAYLNFDEHYTTWIKFFDWNNKLLVNWLNILEEKRRNNGNIEEIRKLFTSFVGLYTQHTENQITCIWMHNYANTEYMAFLHKKQLDVLIKIKNTLSWIYWKLTPEHIESIKDMSVTI